jgi:hypothetical protein
VAAAQVRRTDDNLDGVVAPPIHLFAYGSCSNPILRWLDLSFRHHRFALDWFDPGSEMPTGAFSAFVHNQLAFPVEFFHVAPVVLTF